MRYIPHVTTAGKVHRMSETKISVNQKEIPFEEALAELETIVAKMEAGGLTLDQLMEAFEKGKKLTAQCRGKLEGLEKKIQLLSRDDGADGKWVDFDPAGNR